MMTRRKPCVATLPLFVMDCRVQPGNDTGEDGALKRNARTPSLDADAPGLTLIVATHFAGA
ncbi:MAG: hypothetical protein WB382_09745 [Pseudolabrys sp.]